MNKLLFVYSKIASCVVFGISLVEILLLITSIAHNEPNLSKVHPLLSWNTNPVFYLSISIWLGLFAFCGVKDSFLKIPSVLGVVFSIVPFILWTMATTGGRIHLSFYQFISICDIGIGVVFIWLSQTFNKSLVKVLGYVNGIVFILVSIKSIFFPFWSISVWASLLPIIITYILFSTFLFLFSKSR